MAMPQNPFFEDWKTPFGAPPFDSIKTEHFRPAFERALDEHAAEITAIATSSAPTSFENTIIAFELSGKLLQKVSGVFSNLTAADTTDELQAIDLELAPILARHWNQIYLNEALFARIDTLHKARSGLNLDPQSLRVLERIHLDFVRAGGGLAPGEKARLAEIAERLATVGTKFEQSVLADEQDFVAPLTEMEMAGLPPSARSAAAEVAQARGIEAPYAVTTSRSSVEPFLQFADHRELREKLYRAWTQRGANANSNNTSALITETVTLRAERARLLGYNSYAEYKLADSMAKSPDRARELLERMWEPALRRANEERAALQTLIIGEGANFRLAAWDWRYYSEKLRKSLYDFDEAEIMPYLQLPKMIEAAFHTASRLFGVSFEERQDIPVYHPDVRVWNVTRDGAHVGLFYGDYFARPSKRGGAWMSSFQDQHTLDGPVTPLVVNVCNFPKAEPALLSFDDARTLFHEFGHALHGLLSNVRFPRLSGTNVARDFVELPSQIFEHWLEEPEILSRFAVHAETGEPMPKALLEKLIGARNFNQGFATVEFLASALVDMDFHSSNTTDHVDPATLESATLTRIGMPEEIAMRHGSAHFLHVFGGDGYAAGYYAYLWSEMLDADGFRAFQEAGNPFDPPTAARLLNYIYSAGGTRDFDEAYRLFRGRDPDSDAALEGRGLKIA